MVEWEQVCIQIQKAGGVAMPLRLFVCPAPVRMTHNVKTVPVFPAGVVA